MAEKSGDVLERQTPPLLPWFWLPFKSAGDFFRADLQNFAVFDDDGVLAQSHFSLECEHKRTGEG